MNARDQAELAEKLETALQSAGILVERQVKGGSRLVGHEPVPAVTIIGVLAARGWVVSLAPGAAKAPLHLVKPGAHRDGHEL